MISITQWFSLTVTISGCSSYVLNLMLKNALEEQRSAKEEQYQLRLQISELKYWFEFNQPYTVDIIIQ